MNATTAIAPAEIIEIVAADFSMTVDDFKSNRRLRMWCHARYIAAYLIRLYQPGIGLIPLSQAMGRPSHSGIVHSLNRAAEMLDDPEVEKRVNNLIRVIDLKRACPEQCPLCGAVGNVDLLGKLAKRLYPEDLP